ncbi:MAG TPA: restriction endonuclease subunit S [Elusimicrobiales bacterium]|nr:restriction endonuclease subunit S [Elusimicrobiales bacterium]
MYRLKKAESFIEFKNGKSIKPEKDGVYPIYGANGVIGMSSKYREENSVVIGRVGAYCGSVQFCKGKYWASDNTIVAYPKNSDTYIVFLYYLLKNSNLSRWAGGSAQPLITQTLIRQIELHYTNINNQHKIASILSAYDDLIENNTKRIKILEQMADAIYKEWFIKFRFPGYEKVKFVNSELGKIPEGWEVKQLDKYVDFERGIEPGSDNYENFPTNDNIPFLRVGDLGNRNSEIFVDVSLAKDKIINEDDIVVSMDGTPGIVKIGLFGCYSTGIRKLIIKDNIIKKSFLYFLMSSEHIQNIIKAYSKGTTILHAGESIKHMNFVLPDSRIIKIFDDIVSPIMKEILLINKQNKILRQTRDILLPKLISGELDVSDLEIKVRETDKEKV